MSSAVPPPPPGLPPPPPRVTAKAAVAPNTNFIPQVPQVTAASGPPPPAGLPPPPPRVATNSAPAPPAPMPPPPPKASAAAAATSPAPPAPMPPPPPKASAAAAATSPAPPAPMPPPPPKASAAAAATSPVVVAPATPPTATAVSSFASARSASSPKLPKPNDAPKPSLSSSAAENSASATLGSSVALAHAKPAVPETPTPVPLSWTLALTSRTGDPDLVLRAMDRVSSWEIVKMVRRQKDGSCVVSFLSDEAEREVSGENCKGLIPFDLSKPLQLLHDLTRLPHGNPQSVLYAIYQRYCSNLHYTFVGPMLVAINPYQWLKYPAGSPHPEMIAVRALAALEASAAASPAIPPTATVLITGPSGAGKTEATKLVVGRISAWAGIATERPVVEAIRSMDPILELFGNAPTAMNNNSSRFAKLLTLELDRESRAVCSVEVESYLLEVSRLVSRNEGEGMFHIFALLFSGGLRAELRQELEVWDATQFVAMRGSVAVGPPYRMQDLLTSLDRCAGLSSEQVDDLFRILAGVLHLLNVEFCADDAYSPASVVDPAPLQIAAKLLGLARSSSSSALSPTSPSDASPLEVALTSVQLGNDRKLLHKAAATATRDTLCRSMYEAVFQLLLSKISRRGGPPASSASSTTTTSSRTNGGSPAARCKLNVLDIFGFETVAPPSYNSLEQLLINYTNELLQSLFDETTFTAYRTEAEREGVLASLQEASGGSDAAGYLNVNPVAPCLDVLTRRPNGVLNVISDDSALAQQSAQQAAQLADKILALQRVFPDVVKRNKVLPTAFQLVHYCETVEYSTELLAKRNRISSGVAYLMRSSTNALLRDAHAAFATSPASKPVTSQISQFRDQLDRLTAELRKSSLFWIRCVKPNHEKSPVVFRGDLVSSQLGASGVYHAVELQVDGYAVRISHADFANQYLTPFFRSTSTTKPAAEQFFALVKQGKYRDACSWATKTAPPCQNRKLLLGATCVFVKARSLVELEECGAQWKAQVAAKLQRVGRGYAARVATAKLAYERQKATIVAEVRERIAREAPVRQQLESERIALHQAHARTELAANRSLLVDLSTKLQRKCAKLFRAANDVTGAVGEELTRVVEEFRALDDARTAAEHRERSRYATACQTQAMAHAQLVAQRQKQQESQRKREQLLEKARAREAERERQKILSLEDERRLLEGVAAKKQMERRAAAVAELRQLKASQRAYERSLVQQAERALQRQQERLATESNNSVGRASHSLMAHSSGQNLSSSSRRHHEDPSYDTVHRSRLDWSSDDAAMPRASSPSMPRYRHTAFSSSVATSPGQTHRSAREVLVHSGTPRPATHRDNAAFALQQDLWQLWERTCATPKDHPQRSHRAR